MPASRWSTRPRARSCCCSRPPAPPAYEQIESIECSEDGKTVTTTYSAPFADWQTLFQDMVPGHVVEREAGVPDMIAAYESEDIEALTALAEFWNTGFTPAEPGTVDPAIFLSGDAFIVESWEPGNSITLAANPNWWGDPPGFDQLVIRFVAEEAQAQALANGEINTMYPQPTPDLITQLEANSTATVETGPIYTVGALRLQLPQRRSCRTSRCARRSPCACPVSRCSRT